jgi:hypothetical protein
MSYPMFRKRAVFLPALGFLFMLLSCSANTVVPAGSPVTALTEQDVDFDTLKENPLGLLTLELIAETERQGAYVQGLALEESRLREEAGDYPGAVFAACKELAWAYGFGLTGREAIEQGLRAIFTLEDDVQKDAVPAARGALAFLEENWTDAEKTLASFSMAGEDPDSFLAWMLLVCRLEQDSRRSDEQRLPERTLLSAYGAIRGRYERFPEYWYRGARAFAPQIASYYAERCISLAPEGPFASECRSILAAALGLDPTAAPSIRSRGEIEGIINQSVLQEKPELLSPLLPLISLPENTYTIYAMGALRALSSSQKFRDYFSAEAARNRGRLSERLLYISRG